jgi:hypothetical protein
MILSEKRNASNIILCVFQNFFSSFLSYKLKMPLTSCLSERVALEILDSNDEVLSISIMDKKGNILAPL